MPIKPELRRYYGREHRAYRLALIAAHGARCQFCRHLVPRYINLAHLEHDPARSGVVALLCPACHNRHDAAHRLAVWRRNRADRHGQLWLMPEIEFGAVPLADVPDSVLAGAQEALFA